jgi:hypothetical protein
MKLLAVIIAGVRNNATADSVWSVRTAASIPNEYYVSHFILSESQTQKHHKNGTNILV